MDLHDLVRDDGRRGGKGSAVSVNEVGILVVINSSLLARVKIA